MAANGDGSGRTGGGAQAIGRAIAILRLAARGPVSLPEIIDETGLASTTAYRIATALVQGGLLAHSGRGGFSLGPLVNELANATTDRGECER